MKYRESQKDKKLREWFATDMSKASLKRIKLEKGTFRGMNALDIKFEYPITAIAGRNGAGKSTVLALACCAFHNGDSMFKLPKRKNSYYTFQDFFVQNSEEITHQEFSIRYSIAYNNWSKATIATGVAVADQVRKKKKNGKWNDYDTRVKRTVIFLGIDRIVPHSERSQSRSYSKVFKHGTIRGWEDKVKDAVGYILNKSYLDFRYLEHSKYTLPIVKTKDSTYSGFNMGAGENALFEIFSTIYSAGPGALLAMDEIELGLHADAQKRFVDKLKDVCAEMLTQIVCTTHSREIFECLPPDARYFMENIAGKTKITQGISSDFAFNKMGGEISTELDIFVEDDVAKAILTSNLPSSIRKRITLTVIGSANALSRQLAASYIRNKSTQVLAIFDGDQRSKEKDNINHAKKMTENPEDDFHSWISERLFYLPGSTWPEAWLMERALTLLEPLSAALGTEPDILEDAIEYANQAGKHNEFFEISKHIGLDEQMCLQHFSATVVLENIDQIKEKIEKILAQNA
ncbi:ATP-dependent endonuclease [Acidovorax sp. Root217]|uniref:ATP-dependent nuclease n=1 Tax=Acidovorax sp. Root217 TaxID=1736492 RepID=UPI0009EC8BD0|nr:AAA family ATPase [Acidovorax sp. Root217]